MGVAEPLTEEEPEVAVAVGGAGVAATKTGSAGGGVWLVWGVGVEGDGGAVFDVDGATATTLEVWVVEDLVPAEAMRGPPSWGVVHDGAEHAAGPANLVCEAPELAVADTRRTVGAAVTCCGAVHPFGGGGVSD